MKKYSNVRQVKGEDLIIGNTYYLDRTGRDKGIFEGISMEHNDRRCLFTPIGDNAYLLYDELSHNGQYVGKFSISIWGYFFEETQSDTHL